MTTKDWLVEINKWLKKNGYPMYDMKKMTKKEWGLLKILQQKILSLDGLHQFLDYLSHSTILQKTSFLSTYIIACVDGVCSKLKQEESERKIKEQSLSAPGEKVRAWAKDKREHPEKYGPPKKPLDRKTAI